VTPSPAEAAHVYVGAFVDELSRSGVKHVCIAPGSRSTPLALTIGNHPALETWVHLDERSAAFFALGMARMLGAPVAILCTSGTAAANFFPAIVEARRAGVPLLVLTADRPPEMRDVGSAQTIDQNRLYGEHVKWFVDVALPEATPELLRYVRTLAGRACSIATATPPGPVHLNFPFREPLLPVAIEQPSGLSEGDALAWSGRARNAPWVMAHDPVAAPDSNTARRLADELRSAERPLIVCGPQYDAALAAPLAALAAAVGAPLLADPLSQLRWGAHDRSNVIDRYDSALRHEGTFAALAPDLVLRIGAPPTSKTLLQYLQRQATARHIIVDAATWPDPLLIASEMVHCDPRRFAETVGDCMPGGGTSRASDSQWLARWRNVEELACTALSRYACSLGEMFEGSALAEVAAVVPSGGTLFVSSSMPVRDLDSFASGDQRVLRVLANRGANGIDGVVSTALGAAAARGDSDGPLVLVIGDIAFYHDMNGLLAAKLHELDATIVVINNDGGGIFSFLPQSSDEERFEPLFGTPHGLGFAPAGELYGAAYHRVETLAALRERVSEGVSGHGLHIVEVRTGRARNVILHREAWSAVALALEAQ
jgi:2-succinyl-5-enolpyruvyl-6-hydroxy-3-cyclohexene-1-carboxylate synthase